MSAKLSDIILNADASRKALWGFLEKDMGFPTSRFRRFRLVSAWFPRFFGLCNPWKPGCQVTDAASWVRKPLVGTGAGVFRLISKSRVFSVFNFSRHFFFVSSRFAAFEFMIVVIGEHRNCRLPYRIFIAFGTFLTTLQHMSRVVLDWTQLSSIKSELFRQVHGHSVESKLAPSTTESGWT